MCRYVGFAAWHDLTLEGNHVSARHTMVPLIMPCAAASQCCQMTRAGLVISALGQTTAAERTRTWSAAGRQATCRPTHGSVVWHASFELSHTNVRSVCQELGHTGSSGSWRASTQEVNSCSNVGPSPRPAANLAAKRAQIKQGLEWVSGAALRPISRSPCMHACWTKNAALGPKPQRALRSAALCAQRGACSM